MQILKNFDLKDYNSFGFNAIASNFAIITSEEELIELAQSNILDEMPRFILGGGSNVLFTQNFDGLIVHIKNKGIQILAEDDMHVTVSACSGESWEDFVDKMVSLNYGGIENLSLIPGFCGSSAVQNIGAYGVEVCDVIVAVRYYDLTDRTFKTINGSDCRYVYRDSIFKHELKNRATITNVTFKLTKNHQLNTSYGALQSELAKKGISKPTIQDIATIIKDIRHSKLPDVKELGSAGSFFKNPYLEKSKFDRLKSEYPDLISFPVDQSSVKLAAGQLIDLCGWKGKVLEHVGVHNKQALILVHYGGGSGNEMVNLSNKIIDDVYQKFGVRLLPEVIFI